MLFIEPLKCFWLSHFSVILSLLRALGFATLMSLAEPY